MPKFVVTHVTNKLPPFTPEVAKQMRPIAEPVLREKYPEIVWNYAFIDNETGRAVCDWDGPSAEVVEDVLKKLGMPYDAVFPVTKIGPHDFSQM